MAGQTYSVRRGPMQYGELPPGQNYDPKVILDIDQVFELRGYRNDEVLVRLGFVSAVSERARPVECGRCGEKFVTEAGLHWHGRRRHEANPYGRTIDEQGAQLPDAARPRTESERGGGGMLDATGADAEMDNETNRIERLLEETRPIFWEKTTAAQKAGDAPVPEVQTAPPPVAAQPEAQPKPKRSFVLKRKAAPPQEGA